MDLEVKIIPGHFFDLVDEKTLCAAGALQGRLKKRGWKLVGKKKIDGQQAEIWRPKR